ncbi:hypothetical protein Back2_24520 [Nocardioides baekrokdamisoli]|uniref:CAAX prenyl protease 2/Lysostaphin resistance protein A-like domain-containing protein n=1 Tax=Nocardioides baekrokdamisoli TaxID=1804624 RepID=A0A3G9IQ29_9ACTN|nr:CPBP family intramembrane glutamic endopeptidase [Nocardioides baekrokdamisoli]BBH18165.1 hypothetical protein Back2_24520 [Nocardioides baekrokdamisoli]
MGAFVGALVLVPLVAALGIRIANAIGGADFISTDRLTAKVGVTPPDLAALNLNNAGWILVAVALTWFVHRVRPGFLISVAQRFRWRWLAVCFGLGILTLAVTVLVELVIPSTTSAAAAEHYSTERTAAFIAVVALTTPLQAMGEEFMFRGYLTQAMGGVAPKAVAVVVPALLFAAAHGSQGLPVFIDRLTFGLMAGVVVLVSGGLEAGIAMHVLNNLVAFGVAIGTHSVSATLAASGGTWWVVPVTLTQNGVFLVLVVWATRRRGPDFASAPAAAA